jgi:hypothetical protein
MPVPVSSPASGAAASRDAELSAQTRKIARFAERLRESGFYGKVVISYQNGQITDIKTEQTRKLDDL